MENNYIPPDPNWEKLLDQLETIQQSGDALSEMQLLQLEELRALVSATTDAFQLYRSMDLDKGWQRLHDEAKARGLITVSEEAEQKYKYWSGLGIWMAAAISLIVFGVWFFSNDGMPGKVKDQNIVLNNIVPGTFGATLILADGRKIQLNNTSNGELGKEAGVTIRKSTGGELVYEIQASNKIAGDSVAINTLSTAKGQTYQVKLPDGSRLWLNAASSVTFSANLLQDGKRVIRLVGEAYFQVQKDDEHPFIVESLGQRVEVLGTHFNINSYADENRIRTTLLEGSVKVTSVETGKSTFIKPDQQAVLEGEKLKVVPVIAEESIDWKEGVFSFEDEGLLSIMRKVARWYDVDVEYKGTQYDKQTFSGSISRSENISEVLKKLSKISNLDFQVERRKIIISNRSIK